MKSRVLALFVVLLFSRTLSAQQESELEALNSYIHFLNESVHGMVTIYYIYLNNNKELNKYIDLDSTKIINLLNDDLPKNVFDKSEEIDFYEVYSPIEQSEICIKKSSALPSNIANTLNTQVREIVGILNNINQIRFEIEDYIDTHDLNEKESIYGVYEYLEEVVRLFDNYKNAHHKMSIFIKNYYTKTTDELYLSLYEIHNTTKNILHWLRKGNESEVVSRIEELERDIAQYKRIEQNYAKRNSSPDYGYYHKAIVDKSEKVVNLLKEYQSPGYVPFEHELYGKNYYYHNELLIHYFNWSGPGFVRDMNTLLDQLNVPFVLFDENPMIFKVIYPKKIVETTNLGNSEIKLDKPEMDITNRTRIAEAEKPQPKEPEQPAPEIKVDNKKTVRLEIYDHNMIDRDSVSIYFNDELVVENHLLTASPLVLNLEMKEGQQNTLMFDPVNLGLIPPNTLAVSYRYKGRRHRHVIQSDLIKNQRVRINLERQD